MIFNKSTSIGILISDSVTQQHYQTHVFLKYMNDIIIYMPFGVKISKSDELNYSDFIDYKYIIIFMGCLYQVKK